MGAWTITSTDEYRPDQERRPPLIHEPTTVQAQIEPRGAPRGTTGGPHHTITRAEDPTNSSSTDNEVQFNTHSAPPRTNNNVENIVQTAKTRAQNLNPIRRARGAPYDPQGRFNPNVSGEDNGLNAWMDTQLNGSSLDADEIQQVQYAKCNSDHTRFYNVDHVPIRGPITSRSHEQIKQIAQDLINKDNTTICRKTGIRLRRPLTAEDTRPPPRVEGNINTTYQEPQHQEQYIPVVNQRPPQHHPRVRSQVVPVEPDGRRYHHNSIEAIINEQDIYSDQYDHDESQYISDTDEIEQFNSQSYNNQQHYSDESSTDDEIVITHRSRENNNDELNLPCRSRRLKAQKLPQHPSPPREQQS